MDDWDDGPDDVEIDDLIQHEEEEEVDEFAPPGEFISSMPCAIHAAS